MRWALKSSLKWPRTSIRRRLTVLYSVIFFCAGALVVAAAYFLVQHSLKTGFGDTKQAELFDRLFGDDQRFGKQLPSDKPIIVFDDGTALTVGELQSRLTVDQQRLLDDTLDSLLLQSLIAITALGLLSVASGWWISGRVLRPVHRITQTARGVAERNLHERIRLSGPADELKELADTFDGMLERLDTAFDNQQRFVANAAHELRTPLTISRTLVEVALTKPDTQDDLKRLGESLLAVFAHQQRLTDALLMLARSEQAPSVHQPVDLAELAAHALTGMRGEAASAAVDLRGHCQDAPTAGDPVLLGQLAHNLVQNAVRHNRPGGWATVRTGRDGDVAWLTVSNTGPELTDPDVAMIFEPFHRLGAARTGDGGVGLGLSIVRSIIRAHTGRLEASPRPEGGLEVRVELPGNHAAGSAHT
jgi:signal transduction histidine kinase